MANLAASMATAGGMSEVGTLTGFHNISFSQALNDPTDYLLNVAGHAAIGCGSAAAQGQGCGSGAAAAGLSGFTDPMLTGVNQSLGTALSGGVGAAGAALTGGNITTGAAAAMAGYLYNHVGANDEEEENADKQLVAPVAIVPQGETVCDGSDCFQEPTVPPFGLIGGNGVAGPSTVQAVGVGTNGANFYVNSSGTAIPAIGYRAVGGPAVDELTEGTISPRNPATYFTFNNISNMSPSEVSNLLQLPQLPSYWASFDVLQLVPDLKIPTGRWNTTTTLEPITSTFPEYGLGGGTQAITNLPISINGYGQLSKGK